MSPADLALGNQRLLQLADILDTADQRHLKSSEPPYCQSRYLHPCGTPACSLGHWAAANPDRWEIVPAPEAGDIEIIYKPDPESPLHMAARLEFSLSRMEEVSLFGLTGCLDATSAKDAAAYIRAFVARRQS